MGGGVFIFLTRVFTSLIFTGLFTGVVSRFLSRLVVSFGAWHCSWFLYPSIFFKVCTFDVHFGTSVDGSLSGPDIENLRRLVVVENVFIFSVLDSIESNFDSGLMPVVGRGRDANGTSGVTHDGQRANLEVNEGTEGVVGVVNFVNKLLEGEEIPSLQDDVGATGLGTSVGNKLLNSGPIVVPEKERVTRILLVVQGDGEGDGLFDDFGLSRVALHVSGVLDVTDGSPCAKTTPGHLAKVNEVLTPDLYGSATIFGTIAGVDARDLGGWVVEVGRGVQRVSEVARDGYLEQHGLLEEHRAVVIALEAAVSLEKSVH